MTRPLGTSATALTALLLLAAPAIGQLPLREISLGATGNGATAGPESLASDGTFIWVTRQFTNQLVKIRAATGAVESSFVVGRLPVAVAFDGSVWVANLGDNTVTKLRPSDGTVLGTFPVG